MSLLKELTQMSEAAVFDPMMDLICKATCNAKCKGVSYDDAVKSIMAEFRKLDKTGRVAARWLGNKFKLSSDTYDSSEMSDEALKDVIQAFYNHDKHLSANDNITNYRDVNFSPQGAGPGAVLDRKTSPLARGTRLKENIEDDQADAVGEFEKAVKKLKPVEAKKFKVRFDRINNQWNKKYQELSAADDDDNGPLEDLLDAMRDIIDEVKSLNEAYSNPATRTSDYEMHYDLEDWKKTGKKLGATKFEHDDRAPRVIHAVNKAGNIIGSWNPSIGGAYKKSYMGEARKPSTSLQELIRRAGYSEVLNGKTLDQINKQWVAHNKGKKYADQWVMRVDDAIKKELKEADVGNPLANNMGNTNPAADQTGGNAGIDKQQQRGMPQVDPNQGPEGAEIPDPETPPKGTRRIAKSENFSVVLGQNEQVSLVDGKGNVRLSMPFVEWKQLTRQ
jgi:hypothetical protein